VSERARTRVARDEAKVSGTYGNNRSCIKGLPLGLEDISEAALFATDNVIDIHDGEARV